MGLFSKKSPTDELIQFNTKLLDKKLTSIFERLHVYSQDECLKDVRDVLNIGKNQAILACTHAASEKELLTLKGKMACYQEIEDFISRALVAKKLEAQDGKKPIKGTITTLQRRMSAAGSAI